MHFEPGGAVPTPVVNSFAFDTLVLTESTWLADCRKMAKLTIAASRRIGIGIPENRGHILQICYLQVAIYNNIYYYICICVHPILELAYR